ncbi:hypothetical protein SUGI_0772840 [Cryptomeria japonica]|nr:hypothetical protein SUGI_0772840 [Cryptomeria japonica]
MWFTSGELLESLTSWWKESNVFSRLEMFTFSKRLQFLKDKLKVWNKVVFKDTFTEKERVEQEMVDLNSHVISHGMKNNKFLKEKSLLAEYEEILVRKECYTGQFLFIMSFEIVTLLDESRRSLLGANNDHHKAQPIRST